MRLLICSGIVILGFVSFTLPGTTSFTAAPRALALGDTSIASARQQASLWLAGAAILTGVGLVVASVRKRARPGV